MIKSLLILVALTSPPDVEVTIKLNRCMGNVIRTNNPMAAINLILFESGEIDFEDLRRSNSKFKLDLPTDYMESICSTV